MQNEIKKFRDIVIQNFSQPDFKYHEWMVEYHLKIVERIALELCDLYPTADRDVVQVLVWFHDFGKPFDEENERKITLEEGSKVLAECGFDQDFIQQVVECWQLMEKKNEIDIRTTPIETQIVSSSDGASHFTGVFYPSYFNEDGDDFTTTQKHLKEKIEKDWNRKIVLPEVREAFKDRYEKAKEMLGDFPEKFLA
jgi:putative nucleotidyltransferase with HDIG domain